jgi:hypothetical protein
MSLPGFTRPLPPAVPGDRLVLQKITCPEEHQYICEDECKGSWNPDCFQECIDGFCFSPKEST